ncbi:bifunctional UDP-sugar hydrolase/5'-nucleotidase UshA [Volucribacter amazonae]|uniref:Bifunctional UDP-sugar hydrolase/5'-nucleotidase n=1 Tax=Volucribacter amazonae TaxID=256731 RepID=A0A9X4PDB2_9PAST|nr:bifunctional UDP-sugar hydrolase/5'-nucleotidase UshA [Volucribacter amazonae]MDG6896197.1 bifunctional UDP-sugar hydrolase/5'-nucleotidase [Volucribacter amazonae]
MKLTKTLLSVALLASSSLFAYETDKTYRFTLLHLNDTHGHFWKNARGEYGFAAQKTLIDTIRREVAEQQGEVILLHAGDFNTGVPESDVQNAKPDIEGLNMLGVDALVLGNHEFDSPLQLLGMQEEWASFPFLSANVINKSNNQPLVKPYAIFDKAGLKIAVIGLTTEDTAKLGNPEVTEKVSFENPIATAKTLLSEINQTEQPDVRIALTHLGYYFDGQHGMNAPGDVSLARSLPHKSLDIIVGGHTHDTLCIDEQGQFKQTYTPGESCQPDYQNDTWIMQAGEWGKYLGRADFEFKNGELSLVNYQLIPVNLKQRVKQEDGKVSYELYQPEILEDQAVFTHLKQYQDQGDKLLGIEVGEVIGGKLVGDRDIIRFQQTNLGRLIAQSQMERVGSDIAIMNSGGIRTSIEQGKVSYKDLLTVQPFGNMISTVELTGQELLDYLNVVALKEVDMGAYPQFAGVSMIVDRKAQKVSNVKIGGQPLELNKVYKLSLPDYCAAGGDGYPVLKQHPSYVNTGFIDAEMLKKYFEEHSPIHISDFDPKDDVVFVE